MGRVSRASSARPAPAAAMAAVPALLIVIASVCAPAVHAHGWLANPRARNFGNNQGNGLGARSSTLRCNLPFQNCPGNPGAWPLRVRGSAPGAALFI
jgi:hypothetical protein